MIPLKNIWNYSQPDYYKFCEVTIMFAHLVAKKMEQLEGDDFRLIDLGTGSGVLACEILLHTKKNISVLTLLEPVRDYEDHIKANIDQLGVDLTNVQIIFSDTLTFKTDQKFHVIVSNPPFLFEGRGRLPQSIGRQKAIFTTVEKVQSYIHFIENSLKIGGTSFFLLADDILDFFRNYSFSACFEVKREALSDGYELLSIHRLNIN